MFANAVRNLRFGAECQDTSRLFGRLRRLTQNRGFPIIPSVQGGCSRYPLGDIWHHSALFDENLRRSWREPPLYMAKLSALLASKYGGELLDVRRSVGKARSESCSNVDISFPRPSAGNLPTPLAFSVVPPWGLSVVPPEGMSVIPTGGVSVYPQGGCRYYPLGVCRYYPLGVWG